MPPLPTRPRHHRAVLSLLVSAGVASCSGGGGGGSATGGVVGQEVDKPGGGTFFVDPHRGGSASRLHLAETVWGRLVDVHQLTESGTVDPLPVFREMIVRETVQSDGVNYRLETNPITQSSRLVVLRHRSETVVGPGSFEALLADARSGLAPVVPRPEQGPGSGPISYVARNACLSMRFDDLLLDDAAAREALLETVRIVTGYPPHDLFQARLLFDPNHGGIAGEEFHSTRVLVDLAISEEESAEAQQSLTVNVLGLPASLPDDARPNVTLHLPTREAPEVGQFRLLTNLSGAPLDSRANGPHDDTTPTADVVRAVRAGRADDGNNGFLLDLKRPEIIGDWPITVTSARFADESTPELGLVLDLRFESVCSRALRRGDIVQAGSFFLEVDHDTVPPDPEGEVIEVAVDIVAGEAPAVPSVLLGTARYLSTFSADALVEPACWVQISPTPREPPERGIAPESLVTVRFSEPIAPISLDPFETCRMIRGDASTIILPFNQVVAEVAQTLDLRTCRLRPVLPLAYGATGSYHIRLSSGSHGITDLAGNALVAAPPHIGLELDPDAPRFDNGGLVVRFSSVDELDPVGANDLRGQFLYDFDRGTIRGRPVGFVSYPCDRSIALPNIMIPFGPGVQTPLSALGSKLQTVWRYCDFGWQVLDESKHNLDIIGAAWAPRTGNVVADFYDRFEVRLAHSRRLPDEARNAFAGAIYGCSGLGGGENTCPPCVPSVPFADNVLLDPRSPQTIMNDRSLGYRIRASDVFTGVSGTHFVPYPMDRDGGRVNFTWRDTSVLKKDGDDSGGIPLEIETGAPLFLEVGPTGRIAVGGQVPAYGLPLLLEIRCFPSITGVGLNPVDVSLAQNAQQLPNFRCYSTGGVNAARIPVQVNPDLALIPQGGFNPTSRPPGLPTAFEADNTYYIGQIDTVVRVSRAHTAWFFTGFAAPSFSPLVVSPHPSDYTGSSDVILELRGARAIQGDAAALAFDADQLDPLGDPGANGILYLHDDPTWKADIRELDGASFLQIRFTFVNDVVAGVTPEISGVGIPMAVR